MAWTTAENLLRLKFTDQGADIKAQVLRLDNVVVLTDPLAANWDAVSKSALKEYHFVNQQVDLALVPDADSESGDRAVLRFLNNKNDRVLLYITDPHDELFVSTVGPNQNVIKNLPDLIAGAPGSPEAELAQIIADVEGNGTYILGDGSPIVEYIDGERV